MRTAFSRAELFVTLLALFVIWALLMPVLNLGREDQRRSQCITRLYEIVKAVQQHELAKNRYPGYVEAFGKDDAGNVKIGTWVVPLLPYLKNGAFALWQDPAVTETWNRRGGAHPLNSEFYQKVLELTCPRDENGGELAPLSYAANCGFFADTLPNDYDGLDTHQILLKSARSANGVFTNLLPTELRSAYTGSQVASILGASNRPTRSSDIRDGLTQTLCVAENMQTDSWSYIGSRKGWSQTECSGQTFWGDEASATKAIRVHVGIVWLFKAQPRIAGVPDFREINPPPSWSKERSFSVQWSRPSSNHAGIYNAGFLGGSAAAISKGIDYRVLQSLMAPHDAESDLPDKQYRLREEDYR